ncbi:PA-phosphatase [Cytophagales bacterium LB-30]|uniref:PA-phosphatase n=1 Tax=Shiella aurantiaca TaxID=3058365 RepID=A0ABT8F2U9_9BACT|nr:PA-phosphatase [Shiella aurantiaca]MDN4164782.1 PA-phosphatase [Shiella aurantiaca]
MTRNLAYGISVIFHPLLLPTLLFGLIFYFLPDVAGMHQGTTQFFMLLAIFITTAIIPTLSLVLLKFSAAIESLQMPNREERVMPFFFISVFYVVTTYLFYDKLRVPSLMVAVLSAITLIILVLSVCTLFVKASAHAAAISGVLVLLGVLQYLYPGSGLLYVVVAMVLIAGSVMWSRLYLQAHSLQEIIIGMCIGLGVSPVVLFLI